MPYLPEICFSILSLPRGFTPKLCMHLLHIIAFLDSAAPTILQEQYQLEGSIPHFIPHKAIYFYMLEHYCFVEVAVNWQENTNIILKYNHLSLCC
jgi:hypothetical protein